MDYRNCERLRKFYWEQVAATVKLLERFVKQGDSINVDTYLKMCEQLGEEPDPEKMPLETSDFPAEVQVAFLLFGYLSDRFEGMSGTYMGKDWSEIEHLFKLYKVDEPQVIHHFMKMYEGLLVQHRAEKSERKRKAEERKSAGGGKNFTHNVKG